MSNGQDNMKYEAPARSGRTAGAPGMTSIASMLAATITITALLGCQSAPVAEPLTGKHGGNEAETQLEFWHQLATRPLTSNDDAFHGLILFMNGQDDTQDYAGRVRYLNERDMLPANFDRPANEAVRRGTMAVALVALLEIRGGLVLSTFGPTPRYATRELRYRNIFPPSSPNQTFSGPEFLSIIGQVEDFQRTHGSMRLRETMESQKEPADEPKG